MKPPRKTVPDASLLKLAEEIDQHLNAIRQRLRAPLETAFASGGLTGAQRAVMHVLVTSEGLSLKQLSERVGLAHSTVSGIVDRLEARGFVVRSQDKADRRATVIDPSPQVREFLSETMPQLVMSPLTRSLAEASPRDRATVIRGLRRLRTLIERSQFKTTQGRLRQEL